VTVISAMRSPPLRTGRIPQANLGLPGSFAPVLSGVPFLDTSETKTRTAPFRAASFAATKRFRNCWLLK
jgi:hypothetical protein